MEAEKEWEAKKGWEAVGGGSGSASSLTEEEFNLEKIPVYP